MLFGFVGRAHHDVMCQAKFEATHTREGDGDKNGANYAIMPGASCVAAASLAYNIHRDFSKNGESCRDGIKVVPRQEGGGLLLLNDLER